MLPPAKPANTDTAATPGRRSTRLAIAIPIALSGKNSSGAVFKENTRTITINRHGAKVATMQALTLGTEVVIENRHLGTIGRANVVWLGERKGAKDSVEIGLQLSEAANIWGIEFPPEDWQESSPVPGGLESDKPAAKPLPPPPIKAPGDIPGPRASATGAQRASPAAPAAAKATLPATPAAALAGSPPRVGGPTSVPGQEIQAATATAIEQITARAEKVLDDQAKVFEERLARLGQDMGFQSQAQLQRAANMLEEKLVASLEQKVKELGNQLTTSRNEMEALLARSAELQKVSARGAEKTKQEVEAAAGAALQFAVDKVSEEVAREHREIQQETVNVTRKRLAEEAAACSEKYRGEIAVLFSSLTDESLRRLEREIRAREANVMDEAAKALDTARDTRVKALEDRSAERLAGFETQLDKATKKAQEKTARELSEHLNELRDDLLASHVKEFQKELSEARAALKDELKSSWKVLAEDAKKQLGTMTHTTVEALNKEGKTGIEEFRGHLKRTAQENMEKAARELDAELRKAAERERQEHLTHLEKESGEAAARFIKELERRLTVARAESDAARDAAAAASTELRAKSGQAIQNASDAVNKHIGAGAVFLKELEEQARARLEGLSEKMEALVRASQSELEKNAAEFSAAAMQGMRASFDTLAEHFQEQIGKSVEELTPKFPEDLQRRMDGVTEKIVEESAALLAQHNREGLELAAAELEKLKDKLVNETEEAIRARLAEAFSSVFIPGGRRVTDRAAEEAQKKT